MNHTRFLGFALPGAAVVAIVGAFLPSGDSSLYSLILQPLSLLVGAALALYVAMTYQRQLRSAFVFLAAYLFWYAVSIILLKQHDQNLTYALSVPPYGNFFMERLGDRFNALVIVFQVITYSMLVMFCVNLLKVVDLRQLNRSGWIVFGVTVVVSIFLATFPMFPTIRSLAGQDLPTVLYVVIRFLDAALIIVLVPVIWLYVQYLKSKQKQSLTFTVVIFGIVCATLFDYLFEFVIKVFPGLLEQGSALRVSIPHLLYLLGYLVIATGLYAHRKQDEWGFKAIERALSRS